MNNGADDDASGTTAVLLLAGAMQRQPPPVRSVLFVCFCGEERGLIGSQYFVDNCPIPLASITGELLTPVALEKGARFAIREGGRTVGSGTITEIIE